MSKKEWIVFAVAGGAFWALLGFMMELEAPCIHCLPSRPLAQNTSQALMIALSVALGLGLSKMRARIEHGDMQLPRYFWEKMWGMGLAASLLGVPFGMLGASFWDKWAPVEKAGSVGRYEPLEVAELMASIGAKMSKAGIQEMSCANARWGIEMAEYASGGVVAHLERPDWPCPVEEGHGAFFVVEASGRGGVDSFGYFVPMYTSQKEAMWAAQDQLRRERALRVWDGLDFDAIKAKASFELKR